MTRRFSLSLAIGLCLLVPVLAFGQITAAEYERAAKLRQKFQDLAINVPETANAIPNTSRFWYRKSVKGGNEFIVVDANTLVKRPAFDHERLAAAISAESAKYTALTLPFNSFNFVDNERAIEFVVSGMEWHCDLSNYACRKTATSPRDPGAAAPAPPADGDDVPGEFDNEVEDGMTYLLPQQGQTGAPLGNGQGNGDRSRPKVSPDGKWDAVIQNYNVFLRPAGKSSPADASPLSFDGCRLEILWRPTGKSLMNGAKNPLLWHAARSCGERFQF